MITTTPNIETARRISILCKAQYCYLLTAVKDPVISIFVDISDSNLDDYRSELEAWCGMKFHIYNESAETKIIENIVKHGRQILPITKQEIKKAEKKLGL